MANAIGYVSEYDAGFAGHLSVLNLTAAIRIERNLGKSTETQPDYRVFAGETDTEIGGAWLRRGKTSGREYISITLADPQLGPQKIYANLAAIRGEIGRYALLWNPS